MVKVTFNNVYMFFLFFKEVYNNSINITIRELYLNSFRRILERAYVKMLILSVIIFLIKNNY